MSKAWAEQFEKPKSAVTGLGWDQPRVEPRRAPLEAHGVLPATGWADASLKSPRIPQPRSHPPMRGPLSVRISDEEVSGGSGPLESAHVKHEQVPPGSRKLTGDEEASGVRTRPPLLYTELQLAHTHLEQPPSLPTRPVRDHFRGACLDVEASSSDVSALLLPYVYGNAVGLKLDESGHVHSDGVHFSVQQTHKYAGPDYDLIRMKLGEAQGKLRALEEEKGVLTAEAHHAANALVHLNKTTAQVAGESMAFAAQEQNLTILLKNRHAQIRELEERTERARARDAQHRDRILQLEAELRKMLDTNKALHNNKGLLSEAVKAVEAELEQISAKYSYSVGRYLNMTPAPLNSIADMGIKRQEAVSAAIKELEASGLFYAHHAAIAQVHVDGQGAELARLEGQAYEDDKASSRLR